MFNHYKCADWIHKSVCGRARLTVHIGELEFRKETACLSRFPLFVESDKSKERAERERERKKTGSHFLSCSIHSIYSFQNPPALPRKNNGTLERGQYLRGSG